MTEARDLLHRLAHAHGVQTSYRGHDGAEHTVSDDTLVAVLAALGCAVEADAVAGLEAALERRELAAWERVLPHTTLAHADSGSSVTVHVPHGSAVEVQVVLEDGGTAPLEQLEDFTEPREVHGEVIGQATFRVPAGLPLGWHRLRATLGDGNVAESTLIVVPGRLEAAEVFAGRRGWGLSVQLYSARSEGSWGTGDLRDLATLAQLTAAQGGDFVLTNPLHAGAPHPPLVSSPYSPVTRRFMSPLYLRIEDLPEYHAADERTRERIDALGAPLRAGLRHAQRLDRDAAYSARLLALRLLHSAPRTPERQEAYRDYCTRSGPGVADFALWCALRDVFAADDPVWQDPGLVPGGALAERYRVQLAEEVDLHRWLQFLCESQLAAAQEAAVDAGMRLGIMVDLAVGADRNTADAWILQDQLVPGMSVGAPPDMYNQRGQDWSQSPWHPERLSETGYVAYRDMLRSVLGRAGGVRVDHILGLFRLWWVPVGRSPLEGAYVHYDHEAMLGILALEAHRAGAVVVGEDLGTFEPWIQHELTDRGLLGTSILWFEQHDGVPRPPQDYRTLCLASVNTHDLPPTAGYLAGVHLGLRERLGLITGDPAAERSRHADEVRSYLGALRAAGLWPAEREPDLSDAADTADVVVALHRFLARAPSLLHAVALVDAVGERRIQNQPGTRQDQYPNWEIPLGGPDGAAVLLEDLEGPETAGRPGFARLLGAVQDEIAEVVRGTGDAGGYAAP